MGAISRPGSTGFLAHESVTVLRPEAMAMATCGFVLVDSYGGVDATCA